ncbi:MAG TPA: AsmA-like C-terminal domain-containing protein, partial [Burkholderiales bacterium]|nr:AsmA-like C-terminal domain-containing protein [Burkholderiales bacterium]
SLAIRDVAGQFGRSGFEGLDASLSLSPPYRFEVSQRTASLSLEELYTAARQVRALTPALKEIGNLTGTATISEVAAEGTLQAPEATRFRLVVSPRDVKVLPQRVDTEIRFDGGSIEVSDRLIEARNVSVNAIDSSLRASIRTEDYRSGIGAIEATIGGDLGAATLERIYQVAGLAPAMQVRAPLHFSDWALSWKGNGDASVRGKVKSAGSVDVEVAARKAGNSFILERLALKGQASDAVLSGEFSGKDINAAFKGNLTGAAIAGLMVQPPVSMQGIEGDLRVGIHLGKPWIRHIEGRLRGTAVTLPTGPDLSLKVEHFDLKASGEKITVEDAVLSVDGNRVEFSGDVSRKNEKIVLDADVRAERIMLTKSMMESDTPQDGEREPFSLSDLPVTGRIGVDIRNLETERLTLAPLVASIAIAQENLDLHITEAALCGITMSGTLKGQIGNLRLAGNLAAHNSDLRKSIACMTGNRILSSGTMDIDAKFSAEGPLAKLGERLDGQFSTMSRDGNIEQFDALNRIFSHLNVTELVRGEKLGATGKGLPFRTAKARGTLAGTAIHIEEFDLDAPAVHIVATGHMDYGNDKLGMYVLVAPLQTANVVVDHIPLINRIFGGAVLALPVQVLGTLKNPIVVPLGPGAVASRLTSIFANTMRLPIDAVKVFSPKTPKESAPETAR